MDARLALAHVYLVTGDHRRALTTQQELLPALERHYGPGHDLVWETKRSLAACHSALGDQLRARSVLRALIAERQQREGPDAPELGELRKELAELEAAQPW